MNPKISIITVVRNASTELDATLTAIEALNYDNKELLVIDGASTDDTPQVMTAHAHYINYWISEPDKGLYDAMNKGLKAATGEYVWFVNAGDFPYDADVLMRVFSPSESYADVYFGETMILSQKGEELGLRRKKLPKVLSWRSMWRGMVVCHQAFIARKEIVPLYDLKYKYVADIQWVIRILKKAKSIERVEGVICKFSEGGVSTRHRRASLKERYRVMRHYFGGVRTFFAHILFVFEAIFSKKHRKL